MITAMWPRSCFGPLKILGPALNINDAHLPQKFPNSSWQCWTQPTWLIFIFTMRLPDFMNVNLKARKAIANAAPPNVNLLMSRWGVMPDYDPLLSYRNTYHGHLANLPFYFDSVSKNPLEDTAGLAEFAASDFHGVITTSRSTSQYIAPSQRRHTC